MSGTSHAGFPDTMYEAAHSEGYGSLEGMALDSVDWLKDYARQHPTSFGLWALGIGFVLGWKLKPW